MNAINFGFLKGKVFTDVKVSRSDMYGDSITFISNITKFILYHNQSCCESVHIEDINGDINDLIGHEILLAEEVKNVGKTHKSETWTFYKLRTIKGSVTIRWYGTSNGYYSETAELYYYYSLVDADDFKLNRGLNVHFSNAFKYFYREDINEGIIHNVDTYDGYFAVRFLIGDDMKEFYFSNDKDNSIYFEK